MENDERQSNEHLVCTNPEKISRNQKCFYQNGDISILGQPSGSPATKYVLPRTELQAMCLVMTSGNMTFVGVGSSKFSSQIFP